MTGSTEDGSKPSGSYESLVPKVRSDSQDGFCQLDSVQKKLVEHYCLVVYRLLHSKLYS
jgi:hypothetical protein